MIESMLHYYAEAKGAAKLVATVHRVSDPVDKHTYKLTT